MMEIRAMNKAVLILPLLVFSLILSACRIDVSSDLSMQDVTAVVEGQETIYTSAALVFEFSGDEEQMRQLVELLSEQLREAGNFRQEERDSQTFLLADFKIPVFYASDGETLKSHPDALGNIFGIALMRNGSGLSAHVAFNQTRFDELNAQVSEQLGQRLRVSDCVLRVYLNNDLSEAVHVTVYSVYVDDTPIPYSGSVTVEHGDEIEIKFSDVLRDSLAVQQESDSGSIRSRKFADITVGTKLRG
jgi:hypothetical protein